MCTLTSLAMKIMFSEENFELFPLEGMKEDATVLKYLCCFFKWVAKPDE